MKYLNTFESKDLLDASLGTIKHKDGAFVFGVTTENGIEDVTIYDQRHPGSNCLKLNPVNMSPLKLDSSSSKQKPEVADILYATSDGKLTLDEKTNEISNTAIAICVIPEVLENFENGDQSDGAVKTARFVSLNYMSYKTPSTGSTTYNNQYMYFGNYGTTIGNVKGDITKDSYIGGKWNTQKCLDMATNQDSNICDGVTNNSGTGYCSPACCCNGYSTIGTKPGDWYLPSIGELYQIYVNKTDINKKRTTLLGSGFHESVGYWSSREPSSNGEYYVNLYNGGIDDGYSKYSNIYVLGFLALEV